MRMQLKKSGAKKMSFSEVQKTGSKFKVPWGFTLKDTIASEAINYPYYLTIHPSRRQVQAAQIVSVLSTPDTWIIGFLEEFPQVSIPKELCPGGQPKVSYYYVKTIDGIATLWSPELFHKTFKKKD